MPSPSSHESTASRTDLPEESSRRIRLAFIWLGVFLLLGGIVAAKAWLAKQFNAQIAARDQKWLTQTSPLVQLYNKLASGVSIDRARKELLKIGPKFVEAHSLSPQGSPYTIFLATDPATNCQIEVRFIGNSLTSLSFRNSGPPRFDDRPWKYFASACTWITGLACFAWIVLLIIATAVTEKGILLHGLIALALVVMIVGSVDSAPGGLFLSSSAIRFAYAGTAFLIASIIMSLRWRKQNQTANRSRCRKCGYDLTGNQSGICPECGTSVRKSVFSPEEIAQRLGDMSERLTDGQ